MVTRVHDVAGAVVAVEGIVQLDGPAGTALSLTPEAARAMAARLSDAATEAEKQQLCNKTVVKGKAGEEADIPPGTPSL